MLIIKFKDAKFKHIQTRYGTNRAGNKYRTDKIQMESVTEQPKV